MTKTKIILFIFLIGLIHYSCEKEEFNLSSNAQLVFSQDTIIFDTIFTTIGSVTKHFTVKNPYNKSIKISEIKLAGNTQYRLNIDGYPGNSINNIEIRQKDSIYIFVEITVNPNGSNLPMIVQDSIVFTFNNTQQDVDLIAFGQDVNLIDGEVIQTQTWLADKPYLVYNSMMVDTNHTLTINPGAKLHFHKNSRLFVAGTIKANGTLDLPITFSGDRLEDDYDEIPGQWDGIWLMPGSKDNIFNFCNIKNAIIGIQVDTLANLAKPTLQLTNSRITNMTAAGIYAQGSTIHGYNNLIANCGQFALALTIGGSYEFYHSTIANYWQYSTRTTPSVLLNNYYRDINGNTQVRKIEKAIFGNCIIYGSKENEIFIDKHSDGDLNFLFDHCLLKIGNDFSQTPESSFNSIVTDSKPEFISWYENNYELDTLSGAKDQGKIEYGTLFPTDINGINRLADTAPDLGAFERVELDK